MLVVELNNLKLKSPVFMAPMSGVSDRPFRRVIERFGPNLTFCEMVASREILAATRRAKTAILGHSSSPLAVQLAGCEPADMRVAAQVSEQLGADLIDINMGCPAKKVVGGLAGSALMRDLRSAEKLIRAVVAAVKVPVTLKMRTGWDASTRNAPELARIAADLGVQMVTVHGRTRSQFFKGLPDWGYVSQVSNTVRIPVIVNGDIVDGSSATEALLQSGADGLMVGRAAVGKPWLISQLSAFLETGVYPEAPGLLEQLSVIEEHYDSMLVHYGVERGTRNARKHLTRYLSPLVGGVEFSKAVNQMIQPSSVLSALRTFFYALAERTAV